jgi:hypothetical protein
LPSSRQRLFQARSLHLLEHLLDLVQLDRPLVLPLELSEDLNLPARDLVALMGLFSA